MTTDDRRLLDRDAPGNQPPAPYPRPTPPEELPSADWVGGRTVMWYLGMTTSTRERVAQAMYASVMFGSELPAADHEDPLAREVRHDWLAKADAALAELAPLLPETTWRSYVARRDAQVRRLEGLLAATRQHEDELVAENDQLRAQLDHVRAGLTDVEERLVRLLELRRDGTDDLTRE